MDGLRATGFRDRDYLVAVEIALTSIRRPDEVGLVRVTDVARKPIDLGIDRDRSDIKVAEATHNAKRNFTAIGHEDLRKHSQILILV